MLGPNAASFAVIGRLCAAKPLPSPCAVCWRESRGSAMSAAGGERDRLFFALWPDALTREGLAAMGAMLHLDAGARAVPEENLHLTVAFVGGVDQAQAASVRAIGAARREAACTLRFDAFEYWPKPEVVVVVARAIDPPLGRLWLELHRELAAEGLALNPKRLRPHVTLATRVSAQPALARAPILEWRAKELSLVRSETGGANSIYTVVATWLLLDER